jgi:hypothetical protein
VDKETFRARFRQRFHDPAFDSLPPQIEALLEIAWEAYE